MQMCCASIASTSMSAPLTGLIARLLAGVTAEDLAPLQLGTARTTALLNALLHLQRLRLCVTQGGRSYLLAAQA